MKTCSTCKNEKEEKDFYRESSSSDGFCGRCKSCERARINYLSPSRKRISYKSSANERGIPYELTREDFMSFWQKPCHYCGDEIKTVGIDRLDNTKGYAVNNCVPCCSDCNRMKGKMSHADFVEKCRTIAEKHARNPRDIVTAQPAVEK